MDIDLKILLGVLLLLSLFLNFFLLYKNNSLKNGLNRISEILSDMGGTGFGRRIHISYKNSSLEKLSAQLNSLMDKFQNILEEKQTLELSQKQLIANISHDIRTPLTSLLGYVEMLKENDGLKLETQKDYLNIINTKGQLLYKRIQDFFYLARLESEDTVIKLQKTNLTDIINEVLAAFYQDFAENGITPCLQLPSQAINIWGDEASIERVLCNLIENAVKYGKEGGVIGIEVREDADKVWVDIWDRGNGIPVRDLPFLFNRLYTAEVSRSEKLRGTGLGLAIAKQLVEKHKGEITVSSIPNEKTVFSFSLNKT